MGTVTDLPIRAVDSPPPASNTLKAQQEMSRRARVARKIMERGKWVSDGQAYPSRGNAAQSALRLKRAVTQYEHVESDCMTQRVRQVGDGWHWWLGLRDRLPTDES